MTYIKKEPNYTKQAFAGIGVFEEKFERPRWGWGKVQYLSTFRYDNPDQICVDKGEYERFFLFGIKTPIKTKKRALLTYYPDMGTILWATNKIIGNFIPKLSTDS